MNPETKKGIYCNGRSYEEHCAWIDALEGEEWLMVHTPRGHLLSIACVSNFKYALMNFEMSADERLKCLNGISSMVFGCVTEEAIAAIEPACDIAVKMFAELNSLPKERVSQAFDDADMFRKLAKLNPSLVTALERCSHAAECPRSQTRFPRNN